MNAIRPPDTRPGPRHPDVSGPFTGVRLQAEPDPDRPTGLAGAFRLTNEEADALPFEPHRALVLVVTCNTLHCSGRPFARRALFVDDVESDGTGRIGRFTVDVAAESGFDEADTWYVTVSLGEHVSDTVALEIEESMLPEGGGDDEA